MGAPFQDISLYTQTSHAVGTPEYIEHVSLENFISDLYVRKMDDYKPPKTSRITIQPAFHDIWKRTWKNGSIITIAPYYNYEKFISLDKQGKYLYTLDLIQVAVLELSEEYNWDKNVFKKAYQDIIENNFLFKIDYLTKTSKDKKKSAKMFIEKNETVTSLYVDIEFNGLTYKTKLFDKKNTWCYDCIYKLAKHGKWFDNDRFGISYHKGAIEAWCSIEQNSVELFESGSKVTGINFEKFFLFG